MAPRVVLRVQYSRVGQISIEWDFRSTVNRVMQFAALQAMNRNDSWAMPLARTICCPVMDRTVDRIALRDASVLAAEWDISQLPSPPVTIPNSTHLIVLSTECLAIVRALE